MAYESEYHHAICASGALDVVCKVLRHTSNEDVYQNVCCLFGLICDCEEARDIIRKGKGLEPVLKTLQSDACRENQGLMGIPPVPPSPTNLEEDRSKLPAVLQRPPYDPDLDADVPPPKEPESGLREVPAQIRREYRDPTHLRRDRFSYDRELQNGAIQVDNIQQPLEEEWWDDEFNEDTYGLFNRKTIKNTQLADNVDHKTINVRPQNIKPTVK